MLQDEQVDCFTGKIGEQDENKIILLVEIPSACGGNAYVLVDEMIQRGFRYMPMVTTEKDSQNIPNSEATYIDTDKFQILLLKANSIIRRK